jgi:hypothetical protein
VLAAVLPNKNAFEQECSMSVQNVIEFGRRAMSDAAINKEVLDAVGTRQGMEAATAAAAVATRHGFPCTADEVAQGYEEAMKASQGSADANGNLSDADLEAIAGGKGGGKGSSSINSSNWAPWQDPRFKGGGGGKGGGK